MASFGSASDQLAVERVAASGMPFAPLSADSSGAARLQTAAGTIHIAIDTNPYMVAITAVWHSHQRCRRLATPRRGTICPSEIETRNTATFRVWPLAVVLAVVTMISADPSFATCTGSDPCNACKNCKYCKYCPLCEAGWEVLRLQVTSGQV
jgi:hypothetical protein